METGSSVNPINLPPEHRILLRNEPTSLSQQGGSVFGWPLKEDVNL